jgi:hypothetical protein
MKIATAKEKKSIAVISTRFEMMTIEKNLSV